MRHAGEPAFSRDLRGVGRQDGHVADGHGIAAPTGAQTHANRQFVGPFEQQACGHALQPRLHLPRDLPEVEPQKPCAASSASSVSFRV